MKLFQNMQLSGEGKRKNIILLSIIGVALIGTIYFLFFYGKSDVAVDIPTPMAVPRESSVLPYGTSINTKILDQDIFQSLKPFAPVQVTPEELGRENLFSP